MCCTLLQEPFSRPLILVAGLERNKNISHSSEIKYHRNRGMRAIFLIKKRNTCHIKMARVTSVLFIANRGRHENIIKMNECAITPTNPGLDLTKPIRHSWQKIILIMSKYTLWSGYRHML